MSEFFWDQRSKKYDEAIQQHDGLYDQTLAEAKAYLSKSDLVLDFGCASGEVALDLAPHVAYVYGVDSSAKMVELAQQKAVDRQIENVSFQRADRPPTDQQITAVVAFNVLHLVDDISQTLAQLYEVLPVGGLLISQTPCLGDWGWLLRSLINLAQRFGLAPAVLNLTAKKLEAVFTRSNFEIIEIKVWDEKNKIQSIVVRKSN